MQKQYAEPLFKSALQAIGAPDDIDVAFEAPNNPEHGDLSTNIAMQLARHLKMAPRAIAENILGKIEYDKEMIEKIDIAGPGFINIKFTDKFYISSFREISSHSGDYGRQNIYSDKKINVEYVSVNPTGLLHLGHGRNASIGDTVANLYEWLGAGVTREYYFNNAGNQMNVLAQSIYARYMQKIADPEYQFPENGYHGEYIKSIADEAVEEFGDKLKEGARDDLAALRKFGEKWCFARITDTLKRMNISQDVFYNEDTLYSEGKIEDVINELKSEGLTYEKDGALWLKLTKLGLNDDRVIVKSSGEPTYRLPDIAYHREKFRRGFDKLIDVFGADHIATVPDVLAGVKALGFDPDKVKVLIHQFVTLTEGGKQVKMSKRTGKSYTLDDLLDEVGADVVRFFLLMRGISTHLEFDLDLAREQSEKNPVFYLQYAHARICSIFENAKDKNIETSQEVEWDAFNHPDEIKLIKELMKFPEIIRNAGEKHEPQILAEYLRGLAQQFHVFYHNCRIIGEENRIMAARLRLAECVRFAIKNGLTILGISAPEKM
jgi:arginyl-tRNA synthetase